jgi:hypothetical protein
MNMQTIPVKILGYKRSQRYAISRSLVPAQRMFESRHPGFQLDVQEVRTAQEMLQYTAVIAFPSLMVGGKLVCVGRFPSKEEILEWLEDEIRLVEGSHIAP